MTIYTFKTIDSTNDEAKRLIKQKKINPNQSTVIVSDEQTKGRGRALKKWESKKGGLYYTLIKKPKVLKHFDDIYEVTQKVGESVQRVIKNTTGISTDLEWPNDILLNNKKCGGILIETISDSNATQPKWVIVGIGLNLNQNVFLGELKQVAISLRQLSGKQYNKQSIISDLTKELTTWL